MKINYMKINGFGKLADKEINLKDNINLIYGDNEAGKTTLFKFISSMFYGASKNKNGKDISDFEKYLPWGEKEYSGKIEYELDNGEHFEVFREFSKKNPKIYNSKGEDISKTFNVDKNRGNEFFLEQTKIDETLFSNTTLVEQQGVTLDEKGQNVLIQKLTNLLATGEDNVSFNKAINQLNKEMLEKIGTERTIGRPLNIINEKLENLKNKKNSFENDSEKTEYLNQQIDNIKNNLQEKEIKVNIIKDIKNKKESLNLEKEKININNNLKLEDDEKIEIYKNKIKNNDLENSTKGMSKMVKMLIFAILIVFDVITLFVDLNPYLMYTASGIVMFYIVYLIIDSIKNKKKYKEKNNQTKKIKYEIEILEENSKKRQQEIESLDKIIKEKVTENEENIIAEYKNKIAIDEIKYLLKQDFTNEEIASLEEEINKTKFKLHTLEVEKDSILKKVAQEAQVDEEFEHWNEQKEELLKLKELMDIAKDSLEEAYSEMKQKFTPKFTEELSKIVDVISEGAYKKCNFTDDRGLVVELKNGEYIECKALSLGTIDQLYLSLRLSAMSEISTESMPIILDEAFAYYDDKRLENILKYINNNYKNNQIIIFTCSNREKEILGKANIEYNLVEL